MVSVIDNNRVLCEVGKEVSYVTQTKSSLQMVRLLRSKCLACLIQSQIGIWQVI